MENPSGYVFQWISKIIVILVEDNPRNICIQIGPVVFDKKLFALVAMATSILHGIKRDYQRIILVG